MAALPNRGILAGGRGLVAPVVIVIGYAGVFFMDLPPRVAEQLAMWGPGLLILLLLYMSAHRFIPKLIEKMGEHNEAQKNQAVAMTKVADGLSALVEKDDSRFSALETGQAVMASEIRGVGKDVRKLLERLQ